MNKEIKNIKKEFYFSTVLVLTQPNLNMNLNYLLKH